MDAGSSLRPVRRHAHVCRVCDSAFTCKAELLEHEQEAHTPISVSTGMPSSKRRMVTTQYGGTDSAGSSPVMTPATRSIVPVMTPPTRANAPVVLPAMRADVPTVTVTPAAVDLFVDHEEVYESLDMMKSAETAVRKTATDSVVSMQQKLVSSGTISSPLKQTSVTSAETRQASSSGTVVRTMQQKVVTSGISSSPVKQTGITSENRQASTSSPVVRTLQQKVVASAGSSSPAMQASITAAENRQTSSSPTVRSLQQKLISIGAISTSNAAKQAGITSAESLQASSSPVARSLQQNLVGSGGGRTPIKQTGITSAENRQAGSSTPVSRSLQQKVISSSPLRQADITVAESRPASSSSPVASSHDQNAEVRGEVVPGTSMAPQSTDAPSHQLTQPQVTAAQNMAPSSAATSIAVGRAAGTNRAPQGDVIKALGLKKQTGGTSKGGASNVTVASTVEPAEEDDTKPDSINDLWDSTVDSRDVVTYEVLGTINTTVSGRSSRDVGIQVVLPDFTKEETTDSVAGLRPGDGYAAPVNNDELQLLAAVSSTRSRDIVTQPEKTSPREPEPQPTPPEMEPLPAIEEPKPEEMDDDVMPDLPDMVEQEVVLETTTDDDPGRSPAKKRATAPKSPVCVVKLPMTPHEFTSTDGAKKRMVAITVARTPRMVSVLLRNRGKEQEQAEQQQPEIPEQQQLETASEANAEKPSEEQTQDENDENKTDAVASTETDNEPMSADSVAAEVASAVQAIELGTTEASSNVPVTTDVAGEAVVETVIEIKPKIEVCMYCEQQFPADEIAGHIAFDHICDQCGRRFRRPVNLIKHVKINHENTKPHLCPVCKKAFPYASYLSEHMRCHDPTTMQQRFGCEHCTKTFKRISGLRKHTKEEHLEGPKPFVCQHCDRRYAYRCALENHMRRHSALRPFECQTCGAGFKHISNLQKHAKTQHPEPCHICTDGNLSCEHTEAAQKPKYRCAKCSRTFESAASLHVHERVHTGEKPEVCEVCGRAFQHRSNLQKHMMKHTGRRPHTCPMCPHAFYARHSLMAHMRKHTGDSPYHCETCGKRFCTKNSLQVHMNLHNDVKPFACDTCGRQFAQLGNLQKHMSVHTGERPHRCTECTRCFSDLSALRRHCAAIHERDARYHCETCGKKFLHLSSARSHRMQHDGVKPHYCTVCGKTFTHRSGWMRHCRVHHHKDPNGVVRARVGEDSKEVLLKPGEYIVYLTE